MPRTRTIMYKGPQEFCAVTGYDGAAGDYLFQKGVPQEVPEALAASLMGNNPEPWQAPGPHVFELKGGDD